MKSKNYFPQLLLQMILRQQNRNGRVTEGMENTEERLTLLFLPGDDTDTVKEYFPTGGKV